MRKSEPERKVTLPRPHCKLVRVRMALGSLDSGVVPFSSFVKQAMFRTVGQML